jgi:hypothetical protein
VSTKDQGSNLSGGPISQVDNKSMGDEHVKRRKLSPAKQESESSTTGEDYFTISPCLVNLGAGVRITTVAAGGRHTLVLSGKSIVS